MWKIVYIMWGCGCHIFLHIGFRFASDRHLRAGVTHLFHLTQSFHDHFWVHTTLRVINLFWGLVSSQKLGCLQALPSSVLPELQLVRPKSHVSAKIPLKPLSLSFLCSFQLANASEGLCATKRGFCLFRPLFSQRFSVHWELPKQFCYYLPGFFSPPQ
jgi:hypothetical protein